jgi:hypothetical protein
MPWLQTESVKSRREVNVEVELTGKESNEGKEKGGESSAAHFVEGLCIVKIVGWQRKEWKNCVQVCVRRTGLTAMAIDIAYLYTNASQSHKPAFPTHLVAIRKSLVTN